MLYLVFVNNIIPVILKILITSQHWPSWAFDMKQNKKLRWGEELETGAALFWLPLCLTQRRKVLNEQTLFAIYHPRVSCNAPGRVGLSIVKTYELLKVDSESHQMQFSFHCKQFKVLWAVGQLTWLLFSLNCFTYSLGFSCHGLLRVEVWRFDF